MKNRKWNKNRFISLNVKVLFLSFVIAIIPISVIGTMLYQKSIDIVKQKQEIASQNALQNISDNLQITMDYANNLSHFIIQNKEVRSALLTQTMTPAEYVKNQNAVLNCLTFYTGQRSYIDSIFIRGTYGISLAAGAVDVKEGDVPLMKRVEEAKGGAVWTSVHYGYAKGEYTKLMMVREIRDMEHLDQKLGTLWIAVSNWALEEQLQNYTDTYSGYIALINQDGEVMNENGDKSLKAADDQTLEKESKGRINNRLPVEDTGWYLYSSTRLSTLLAENRAIMDLLVLGIAVSMILCIGISIAFSRAILHPLKLLTNKIKEIKEDNYKISLDFKSSDEIGILSKQFNGMARRLDELVNEVLAGKVLQGESELKALQSQIDPHFLYNNLDTAYWMSRLEKAPKTGKILLALSDLYRLSVSSVKKLIPVETEVRYIQNYITIQQLRVDDQICFTQEVEPDTLSYLTMRFVLQPLVENSIQHGILPTGRIGSIVIRIYSREWKLYFEVEDDGCGIDAKEIKRLLSDVDSEECRGMAIRNIDQRIKIKFGEEYGVRFESTDSGHTLVQVIQPLLEGHSLE